MKTGILIPIIFLAITSSSFKSPFPFTADKTQISRTIQYEGLFGEYDCAPGVVYSLTRNGKELEYQSPYVFYFCPDHTLTAVGARSEIPGNWYKDEANNTVTIKIDGPHEIFKLVSGVWQIIEHTEYALELETFQDGEYRKVRFERMQR